MGKTENQPALRVLELSLTERDTLLCLARQAIELKLQGLPLPDLQSVELSVRLQEKGSTFVTLTNGGQLRGCVGGLEATMPLAEDARIHAIAAALRDYRFHPVNFTELPDLCLEISCLSALHPVRYHCPEELLDALTPGIDGVVIKKGNNRSTFLPQVWEKIPDKAEFLSLLCNKLGYPPDFWRQERLEILTYRVDRFHESRKSLITE